MDKLDNHCRSATWLASLWVVLGVALAIMMAITTTVLLPDENRVLPAPGVGKDISPVFTTRRYNPQTVEQGRIYYVQLCLACHGVRGDGLGEWAYRVTPHPADLRATRTQQRSDQQLFDIISDGLFGTPMIGWKRQLSAAQRMQLVTYLRTLPERKASLSERRYE